MQSLIPALALFVSLVLGASAFATEPGTPMDCSDLELAPGLTCSEVTEPLEDRSFGALPDEAIDNEGRVLSVGTLAEEIVGSCAQLNLRRAALVVAFDGGADPTPLVTRTERCVDPTLRFLDGIEALGAMFDAARGSLLLHLSSRCQIAGVGGGPGCPYTGPAPPGTFSESLSWIARIDGFPSLSEVLPPQCRNGLDDDGDGDVDAEDAHCKSDADNDESRP